MAKRSDKDGGSATKGRPGETKRKAPSAGARTEKPRIKVTHSEAPAAGPPGKQKRAPRGGAPGRGRDEIEKRTARARDTVRSLGARPAAKRLPLPPQKAREAIPPELRGPGPRKRSVPPPAPSDEARRRAVAIAAAGLEKKAIGVEVLDVTGRVDYADYLVIMTGTSDRHVHAIAMGIEESLRRLKVSPLSVEGLSTASWVLMDFDDVVVHVFQEETRRLYDIEGLWMDASRVTVDAGSGAEQPVL